MVTRWPTSILQRKTLPPGSFFSFLSTGTIAWDHYVRECKFGILKNSSVVWEFTTEGERPFHCGIVQGKKRVLQGITVCLVSTILGTV